MLLYFTCKCHFALVLISIHVVYHLAVVLISIYVVYYSCVSISLLLTVCWEEGETSGGKVGASANEEERQKKMAESLVKSCWLIGTTILWKLSNSHQLNLKLASVSCFWYQQFPCQTASRRCTSHMEGFPNQFRGGSTIQCVFFHLKREEKRTVYHKYLLLQK